MKTIVLLLLLALFGCSSENALPEFDGGYVQTKSNGLIQLQNVNMSYNRIALKYGKKAYSGYGWFPVNKLSFATKACSIKTKCISTKVQRADFKGITIKGLLDFKLFTLHKANFLPPTSPKLYAEYGNYSDSQKGSPSFEKKYNLKRGVMYVTTTDNLTIAIPGEKIPFLSKKLGDNTYYYQPEKPLPVGYYVAWIQNSLWWFQVI